MISYKRVRELFDYNPETGVVVRRLTTSPRAMSGMVVGCLDHRGYLLVNIDRRLYKLHRVVWLWMTGSWPEGDIDHCDRDSSNNRWGNLRDSTKSQNLSNRTKQSNNTSGFKGVYWNAQKCKWHAKIALNRKDIHLGFFDAIEDAHVAYCVAAKKYHGEFSRIT